MAINIYKTDLGIFSVVVSDDTYNSVNALGSGNIMDSNGITTLGTQFLSVFPASGVPAILFRGEGTVEIDTTRYLQLTTILPLSVIHTRPYVGNTTITSDHPLIGYSTKIIRVNERNPFSDRQWVLNFNSNFRYGTTNIASTNGCTPYGSTGVANTTSNRINYFKVGFLYSNTSMSSFGWLEIVVGNNNQNVVTISHNTFSANNNTILQQYFDGVEPYIEPIPDNDPYADGGSSTTGGGNGNYDNTSDVVDFPTIPSITASDTGFITLFKPSLQEMRDLASYMWTGLFDVASFKKIFANPMDCILGLSIVPISIPGGTPIEVKVGNISTGIYMTPATSQYVDVDCGSLNIEEYWGAYLDYSPYTKAELYLPYIGIHAISIDDIMGKTVTIKYRVDILSGACVAFVKCGDSILYSFIGQCASSIPITGNDWTNVINGIMSIAGSVGSMVASGGMTAPLVAPGIASTAVNSMKPTIEKSGSLSGTGGLIGLQKPYFIITRPRQALPENQNTFTGYPSFITKKLADLTGYTEVEVMHLENISATNAEIEEIEILLKKGVIF